MTTIVTQAKKITESKPFYALTGAGDFAVEKARAYASTVQDRAETVARELPEKARGYADAATTQINRLYDDLASRGRKVVSRVSGEAALELTEVSETAEPAVAAQSTTQSTTGATTGATTGTAAGKRTTAGRTRATTANRG
ncbi:hypothetical protein OG320_17450 [Microbispora sp. NBC_01189]|uniref:hypothetical protein n=1 Tax=Microbispora sp. NBC_01189 TaxID=2903583 RepID=UPI002E162195|nr:hypothetical protein OG320_17450 [Microbispora sp. NBC_01189]